MHDPRSQQAGINSKGRARQAVGCLNGDKGKMAEGRSDQREGTAKEKSGAAKDLAG